MKLKHSWVIAILAASSISAGPYSKAVANPPGVATDDVAQAISSKVEQTKAGELILIETVTIAAPVARVWNAYTTSAGFASWAAPVAEVDCRVGGSIRTQYDPKAKIGDPNTNTLRIINYVPQKMLTLQADVSANWPEVLKSQASQLYNVILFEELDGNKTRIISYGLGYQDNEEMRGMMGFFIKANEGLYAKLIKAVE